jgi:hypothetical protein
MQDENDARAADLNGNQGTVNAMTKRPSDALNSIADWFGLKRWEKANIPSI